MHLPAEETPSWGLQHILIRIYQYKIRVLHKPGPDLFTAGWLSQQNHEENKDNQIHGLKINNDVLHTATNMPECLSIQDIQ